MDIDVDQADVLRRVRALDEHLFHRALAEAQRDRLIELVGQLQADENDPEEAPA